jgi:hypothetical protein
VGAPTDRRSEPSFARDQEAGDLVTPLELGLLPFSVELLALGLGIRFLTDYLAGDSYFRIANPWQNLNRCRIQLAIALAVEAQLEEMHSSIEAAANRVKTGPWREPARH